MEAPRTAPARSAGHNSPLALLESWVETVSAPTKVQLAPVMARCRTQPAVCALFVADPWMIAAGGFATWQEVEAWAEARGLDPAASPTRVNAAIRATLEALALGDGHLAVEADVLLAAVEDRLGGPLDEVRFASAVHALTVMGTVVVTPPLIALASAAACEDTIARCIHYLNATPIAMTEVRAQFVAQQIAASSLAPEQAAAVHASFRSRFVCVTGPAGTGKSRIISALYQIRTALKQQVLVGAPTGKAADVLKQRAVPAAQTVHALLGRTPDSTAPLSRPGQVSPELPREAECLIIDEATMIDSVVWELILLAAVTNPRLAVIAFGDAEQLGPVSPGAPFEAFVASDDVVTVVRIETVRRTEGMLTNNGLAIRRGVMPRLGDPRQSLEAAFYPTDAVPAQFVVLAEGKMPAGEKLSGRARAQYVNAVATAYWLVHLVATIRDDHPDWGVPQVITPVNGGPLGTHALNGLLRERLNPAGKEGEGRNAMVYAIPRDSKEESGSAPARKRPTPHVVRRGDLVILGSGTVEGRATNGDKIIARNGTAGEVVEVLAAKRMVLVRFDGIPQPIEMKGDAVAAQLSLRYALTVNKTQGSEYPCAICVLHAVHGTRSLTRKRLYTAYTRGRQSVLLLGTEELIRQTLANVHADRRMTALPHYLRAYAPIPAPAPDPTPDLTPDRIAGANPGAAAAPRAVAA